MNGNIGFVGEPKKINKSLIQAALGKNQIPVIAPLGYDSNKNTLNINADTLRLRLSRRQSKPKGFCF